MTKNQRPIGIFDSGLGGLAILTSLIEKIPNEKYIYIADQKNCPYGTKGENEIREIIRDIAHYFDKLEVKMVIVACNTASLFVEEMTKVLEIPVIPIIELTAMEAVKRSKRKRIGVIATEATIQKASYQKILEINDNLVWPLACSELVELIEDDNQQRLPVVINQKLQYFNDSNIDTLILGCTHFSLIENEISKVLPMIDIVSSGSLLAQKVEDYLCQNMLQNVINCQMIEIYTTGEAQLFQNKIKWFTYPYAGVFNIDENKKIY